MTNTGDDEQEMGTFPRSSAAAAEGEAYAPAHVVPAPPARLAEAEATDIHVASQHQATAVPRQPSRGLQPAPPLALPPQGPAEPGRWWSNLDLNGGVPTRAQPAIGDWGPNGLPTTREKRRQRWVVPVVFTLVSVVVMIAWRYFFVQLG